MINKEFNLENILGHGHTTVEVPSGTDFVYIMRKDSDFVAQNITKQFLADLKMAKKDVFETIHSAYEGFIDALADNLEDAFKPKGDVETHLFEAHDLEKEIKHKAGVLPIVSLDPLMTEGVHSFCVSRGFHPGGIEDFGQINRPGSESLDKQAETVAGKLNGCPACVVEDDIFSGGSVISALEHLQEAGVKIAKLIPGFQIGKPSKLDAMGIKVDPVVTYKTTDNTDIFSKVDLGDPRDYLMGASGLVIKLDNGTYGRAPYVLPFVSTSARASVPKENEITFAFAIWQENLKFFQKAEQKFGKPLLLKHLDPYFVKYMKVQAGVSEETPMTEVVSWAIHQLKL